MKRYLIFAILLLLVAPAWAQNDDPLEKHFFPPELVLKHQGQLKLTQEQKDAIKAAVQEAQATFTDAQWDLQDAMHAMGELVDKYEIDEARVLNQLEEILELERKIKRAQLTLMVRIKNTLTEKQQRSLELTMQFSDQQGTGSNDLWPW